MPASYDAALAVAVHRGPGRELVHLLKYRGVLPAADFWAEQMAALAERLPEPAEVVTAVPLSRQRKRQRGFNQSSLIGRGLARRLNLGYEDRLLRRRRDTRSQAGLDAAARARNLRGAFEAAGAAGRRVLLVDDVLTTGATAEAAAAALKAAGAARVFVLTATRAEREFPPAPASPVERTPRPPRAAGGAA